MPVPFCHMCDEEPLESRYDDSALETGEYCPVCHRPACRYHLGTVRWRWKKSGQLGAARVCLACKNAYRHRDWDPVHRDWIS